MSTRHRQERKQQTRSQRTCKRMGRWLESMRGRGTFRRVGERLVEGARQLLVGANEWFSLGEGEE